MIKQLWRRLFGPPPQPQPEVELVACRYCGRIAAEGETCEYAPAFICPHDAEVTLNPDSPWAYNKRGRLT